MSSSLITTNATVNISSRCSGWNQFLAGGHRGLLLEYVILETVTVLMVRRDLDFAVRVGKLLMEAKEYEFVPCSIQFRQTLWSFSHQSGTKLSFTDCALAITALSSKWPHPHFRRRIPKGRRPSSRGQLTDRAQFCSRHLTSDLCPTVPSFLSAPASPTAVPLLIF